MPRNTPAKSSIPAILRGAAWANYLHEHRVWEYTDILDLYHSTHNHVTIYKINEYYFCFRFARGYRDLPALKRVLTE